MTAPGELYAEVQPLTTITGKPAKRSRLWVNRRGQRPTETVFTIEIAEADAYAVAQAINGERGTVVWHDAHPARVQAIANAADYGVP